MLKLAKGYRGRANSCFVIARNRVEKALARAYTGRKLKKRDNRTLWITKINASARLHGINYSHVCMCIACLRMVCVGVVLRGWTLAVFGSVGVDDIVFKRGGC
jgi:ribosomal protein L20